MPAVHEEQHECVAGAHGFLHRQERPIGLRGLPEPAFVVGFHEVEIEILAFELRSFVEAVSFVAVAGAGSEDRGDCRDECACLEEGRLAQALTVAARATGGATGQRPATLAGPALVKLCAISPWPRRSRNFPLVNSETTRRQN